MADVISSIKVSGGDYADPQLWENDMDVTVGRDIGEIQDNSEYLNVNLLFSGGTGTPDADNFAWLRVASANKHLGITGGSGHARMRDTAGLVITVSSEFVVIEGLEIVLDSTGDSDECIRWNADEMLVSRCILRATSITFNQDGIHTGSIAADAHVDNCLIYGFSRAGINVNKLVANTMNADSLTIYNCGHETGSSDGGGITLRDDFIANVHNCYCVDNTNAADCKDFQVRSGTPVWAGTDNIASDTTAEAKFTTSFDSVVLIDTDPVSGENVHITSISGRNFNLVDEDGETVTQNGVDRSAIHPAPQTIDGSIKLQDLSTDIKDVARTVTWSIGAFEFVSPTVFLPASYSQSMVRF